MVGTGTILPASRLGVHCEDGTRICYENETTCLEIYLRNEPGGAILPAMRDKLPNAPGSTHVVAAVSSEKCDGRDTQRGIAAVAAECGWTLDFVDSARTGADFGPFRRVLEDADGVIANGADMAGRAVALMPAGVPFVAMNIRPDLRNERTAAAWAIVVSDERRIGGAAAAELLAHDLRAFAFVPMLRRYEWTKPRGDAFLAAVRTAGRDARLYQPHTRWGWVAEREFLSKWLLALPRPFGIFAGNDLLAKLAFDACRLAGLRVPDDAMIIGADDDEMLCRSTVPEMSSVRIDFEGAGRMAARRLSAFMGGRRPARLSVGRYGILGVARRGSTRGGADGADPRVSSGLDFIAAHFADPLVGAQDVAAVMGVSRRQADRLFRATGTSIRAHVEERRMEEVLVRLRGSSAAVKDVAESCGFSSDTYFSAAFRRHFGCAPGIWRRLHADGSKDDHA